MKKALNGDYTTTPTTTLHNNNTTIPPPATTTTTTTSASTSTYTTAERASRTEILHKIIQDKEVNSFFYFTIILYLYY